MASVRIDATRCQGHGRCALIAPDVFDVDDLGAGRVLVEELAQRDASDAEEAVLSCPENAITMTP